MRVVILASGPSMCQEDADACRGEVVIAINSTVALAPWATVAYAADDHWWQWVHGLPGFKGRKISLAPFPREKYPDVEVFDRGPETGLSLLPKTLATGKHSGYSAINLAAVELQATEIVLLGYDMQSAGDQHHWHAPHHAGDPHPSYTRWLPLYESLKEPLTSLGVRVFNASRTSAIPDSIFPRVSLPEVLDAESLDHHPGGADPHVLR